MIRAPWRKKPKPAPKEWQLCDRGAVVRPYKENGRWMLSQQGWSGPKGWPDAGDIIWLPHDRDDPRTTYARYRVIEFRYELDPMDIYYLRAEFVPAASVGEARP